MSEDDEWRDVALGASDGPHHPAQARALAVLMGAWLHTEMTVSYAQVLGAGCLLLFFLWLTSTLALWVYALGRQVRTLRSIEHHVTLRADATAESLRATRSNLRTALADVREADRIFAAWLSPMKAVHIDELVARAKAWRERAAPP